jgi:hypothetical protein
LLRPILLSTVLPSSWTFSHHVIDSEQQHRPYH